MLGAIFAHMQEVVYAGTDGRLLVHVMSDPP